jgi:hypothetical protein
MGMVRNTLLLLFALIIDGLQALFSAALFALGAFPGTIAGGATGTAVGASVAGKVGAAVGGVVGGILGTPLDAFAPATLPIAVSMGVVVNFCIDITLGTILTMWLLSENMYYPRYGISAYIAELIPGLNNLPCWFGMVSLSIIRKSAEDGKLRDTASGAFATLTSSGIIGTGAALVTRIKQNNIGTAERVGTYTAQQQIQGSERQHERIIGSELKNIDGIRAPKNQTSAANDNSPSQEFKYAA